MSPWLEEWVYDAFPDLFTVHDPPMQQTCMCWGFDCRDGWFGLIWELSSDLHTLIQREPEAERAEYCAVQVKEKPGSLRFSMRPRHPRSTSALPALRPNHSEPAMCAGVLEPRSPPFGARHGAPSMSRHEAEAEHE